MGELARKYSDRDVRESDELLEVALEYVEQYKGDWWLIHDAKDLIHQTGTLPIPVARTMLNAMLADPHYQLHGSILRPSTHYPTRRPRLRVVQDQPKVQEKRAILRTVANFHYTVGIPRWKGVLVRIHYVDTRQSYCDWRRPRIGPEWHNEQDFTRWEPHLIVIWRCGKRPQGALLFPTVEAVQEDHPDWEVCKKCENA